MNARTLLAAVLLPVVLVAGGAGAQLRGASPPLIESAAPVWTEAARWRVDPVPMVEIGGERLGGGFAGLVYPARLSDGRIVVGDAGAGEILMYDAGGSILGTVATRAVGPDQAPRLLWAGAFDGDSIAALVSLPTRLLVFGADGTLARETQLRGMAPARLRDMESVLSLNDVSMFADGSLVGSPVPAWRDREHPDTWTYLHFTPAGRSAGVLVRVQRSEASSTPVQFGRWGAMAVGRDRVFAGWNDGYDFDVYRRDGSVAMRIRRPHSPVPVPSGLGERMRDEQAQQLETQLAAARADTVAAVGFRSNVVLNLERNLAATRASYSRETFPAWSLLLADSEGNLWVRAYAPPGDPQQTWSVFDPDGRWLGEVELPAGVRPRQIGPDWVLGTFFQDGVRRVQVYRLHKPAGG